MSTDWHVYCLDCKDTHRFDDANHRDEVMLALCRHADALAALAEFASDPAIAGWDIRIQTPWGTVDPTWFRAHLGHNITPIDEYGNVLGLCNKYVDCVCGARHRCVMTMGHSDPCRRTSA